MVDRIESAADRIRDDEHLADKKRFESFKLGGAPPSSHSRKHSHSRSHSRNLSVSISPSPSLSFSSSFHDLSLSSSSSISSLSQLGSTPAPGAKRGSHHRRCSSVSTRRESAEVMGVSLPALSASNSEDNMSLGDKDSIRRRALWALEGKPSADGFSPVEIPELNTPEIERRISELPSKPSFPPSMASFVSGLNSLANMRDSFSSRVTSVKDQLHTLVEEEEEEEPEALSSPPVPLATSFTVDPTSPTPTRSRQRPSGLSLRPLSLTPDKLLTTVNVNGELATPAPTPTPSKPSGLKSLTLITSPSLVSSPPESDGVLPSATTLPRRSMAVPPTHPTSSASFFRRSSLTDNISGPADPFEAPKKRSSISYKSSFHGLPTPELTPTADHRASTGSDNDWPQPTSVTNEQHFLYQSQAALVARISELEAALASRNQSRHVSLAASDTSSGPLEPTDEMLRLIADLKAERDELKRDIDGWRKRVADLEKRNCELVLAAVRAAKENTATVSDLQAQLTTTKADLRAMQEEAGRSKQTALDLERVLVELAEERRRRAELEKALEESSLFDAPTPIILARRVMSMDSMSSATDVESLDGHLLSGHELKAVQEVDEDEESYSDQENNLMGYEDEEEGDESFTLHDGSSFSSLEDIPRSTTHLVSSIASSPSGTPPPAFVPAHARRSSLSREWSFPAKCMPHSASSQHTAEEIDRFFGCLEDIGDSPPNSASAQQTTTPFSREFFSAAEDDGDELPPFVFPADVGFEVESPPMNETANCARSGLGVVPEEEEPEEAMDSGSDDEFVGEEDEGGIKFTFKIPSAFASPESSQTPSPTTPVHTPLERKHVPYYETAIEDDDATPFSFPAPPPVACTHTSPPSPSAIPRATALKRFEGPAKNAKFSPSRVPLSPPVVSSQISPPNKRGGPRPSFLPQPITKTVSAPTFIPQPSTKALASSMSSAQPQSQSPGEIAVRSSSADAYASAGVRPFAALQNLASLMPLPSSFSWSASASTGEPNNNKAKEQKGFVSKERQLARLRERMVAEGSTVVAEAQIRVGQRQPVTVPCKRCVDRVVAP
ncbi:hypothetical protein BC827DRAFT_1267034 [Russula dissimulans]|nr:hypothetical protein BC827DRAFT_1267034 [Russula dissimulans]